MLHLFIASQNPAKIAGAKKAFETYFPDIDIQGVSVYSGVPEQPVNDEIFLGAKKRVQNLAEWTKANHCQADYLMSVESGISNAFGQWSVISIAVIEDKYGQKSWGTSAAYPIPLRYVQAIQKNGLSQVMDDLFKQQNCARESGGISLLTHSKISRTDLCQEAFIMALTAFINQDIWHL